MTINFKIRDFFYPYSMVKLRSFFERSQWYPLDKLKEYQAARLRTIINHAYSSVPYYNTLFKSNNLKPDDFKTTDDLQQLPTLTKDTLRANRKSLQSRNAYRYHPQPYRTSGTMGEPVEFLLDAPSNVLEFCYYWRHWSWAGYQLGNTHAIFRGCYFMGHPDKETKIYHFDRITRRLLLNSHQLSPDNLLRFVEGIRKHKPRYLKGLASTLYIFSLFLKHQNITDITFDAVFSTGEMLLPHYRDTIQAMLHCTVLDSYGHMERTIAVSQCPEGGYHINMEYGILEIKPASAQNPLHGSITGTSLHNFAMPLLRYELNDSVELYPPDKKCGCGRGLPLVKTINGRYEDAIITPDGRVITTLFTLFEHTNTIELGQIIQNDVHSITLRIAKTLAFTENDEQHLIHTARKFVGKQMNISVVHTTVEELRAEYPEKLKIIVSTLKPPV